MSPGLTSAAMTPPSAHVRADDGGARRETAPVLGGGAETPPAPRLAVLALVVALHGLALGRLLSPSAPQPVVPPQAVPLQVSLLAPTPPANPSITPAAAPQPVKVQRPTPAIRPHVRPRPAPSPRPAPVIEQPTSASTSAISEAAAPSPSIVAATSGESAPNPPPPTPARFDAAYLHNQTPYPPLARRLRESGTVRLRVLVSAQGQAEKVELVASSGSPRLDEGAQEAVRRWRFIPARQGDQPVASTVIVPIIYKLEES